MRRIHRVDLKKSKKSYFKTLFLYMINLFMLYLFLDFRLLLYACGFFGLLLILFAGLKLVRSNRRTVRSNKFVINSDIFKVSLKYLKINKIYVLATIVGLILASIVASQTVLIPSSYQKQLYDDFFKYADDRAIQFDIHADNFDQIEAWIEYLDDFGSIIQENELSLDHITTKKQMWNLIVSDEPLDTGSYAYQPTFNTHFREYSYDIYNLYSSLSSFNSSITFNITEPLLVVPYDLGFNKSAVINNRTIEILVDTDEKHNSSNLFKTIKLHNVNYYSLTKEDHIELDRMEKNYEHLSPNTPYLFMDTSAMDKLINEIFDIIAEIEEYSEDWFMFQVYISSSVYLKLPTVTNSNIDDITQSLSRLENDAKGFVAEFERSYGVSYRVKSPLYNSLINYEQTIVGINLVILLISLPMIALALFLVFFTATMVEQRKRRLITILKARGTSKDQISTMILSEILSASVIAVIVGMILSIPWTILSLKASGILQFDNPTIPIYLPSNWYWRLPLIGIIFSLNLNISSISNLASTKIDEGEITEEKKTPIWQKLYLDLILVGISILVWLCVPFIPKDDIIRDVLVVGFGPVTMFTFLIGIPLVTARYFSSVIGKLSDLLWKNYSGMIALATRNMRKTRFSSSKLVSLLILGMMLTYISVIIPNTYIDLSKENAAYSLGSDIYISGLDSSNTSKLSVLDIPEIEAYTEVVKLTIRTNQPIIEEYTMLGIDSSSFQDAAYWCENYDEKSLSQIIGQINSNTSIGMQSQVMQAMGVEIADYLSIDVTDQEGNPDQLEFNITTDYDYYPNLVDYIPSTDGRGGYFTRKAFGLISLEKARTIGKFADNYDFGMYVKVKENANATALAISLRESFSWSYRIVIKSVEEMLDSTIGSPMNILLIASLQGMTIIALLVSVIAISYFSFISLSERKREVGVFRALGMVRKQVFLLLAVEGIIIIIIGTSVGSITGYSIVNIFFFILSYMSDGVGPVGMTLFRIIIPWDVIGIFTISIIVLTILAAAIPALHTARQQTGIILRAE